MTTTEEPQATPEKRKRNRWIGILIVAIAITAVVTAGITALLANVIERMGEASDSFTKVVELDDTVVDPAVWGQNFPAQYQSFLRTQEMVATTHAGSVAEERTPTATDPESVPVTIVPARSQTNLSIPAPTLVAWTLPITAPAAISASASAPLPAPGVPFFTRHCARLI